MKNQGQEYSLVSVLTPAFIPLIIISVRMNH